MLIYYCAKCQRQNMHNTCDSCGKGLPGTAARYIWSDYRLPLGDVVKLGQVMRIPLIALALLITVMFVMEYILTGAQAMDFLTNSGVLPAMVQAFMGAVAIALLILALQGRENVQYVLDPKGALKRTWIRPTRLNCWARGLHYDKRAIQQNADGMPFLMAHEEYLVWQDAKRYALRPRAGRIKLYRPYAFVFMTLHIPREEYDGAAQMVAAKIKLKK
ncbi:MAG: hypothetical protein GX653_02010 [Clostridiales bacterium]|nr:hypothetical protein [Clostridiales bacterium]